MQVRNKYREIAAFLYEGIRAGKYAEGRFPSENMLARRFGVTRPTVRLALKELRSKGYIVGRQGRGTFVTRAALALQNDIGLLVPGVAYSEFFSPVVRELSRLCTLDRSGLCFYSSFDVNGALRAEQVIQQARHLVERHARGVIFQPCESVPDAVRLNRDVLKKFQEAGIPVVLLDSDVVPPPERSGYDVVGVNNFDAGRRIALHLLAAGAQRIRFAMMPHACYSIRNREAGVTCALAAHGRHLGDAFAGDPTDVASVQTFLRRQRPDALVCCCDTFAAHLMNALGALGKRVPDDLLLAGFDDVQHATIMRPQLTTIRQPCAEIAAVAFRALLDRIADPGLPPREILLSSELVVRPSTRKQHAGGRGRIGRLKPPA